MIVNLFDTKLRWFFKTGYDFGHIIRLFCPLSKNRAQNPVKQSNTNKLCEMK